MTSLAASSADKDLSEWDTSNPDLRAAWLLRNAGSIPLGQKTEEALAKVAAEMKISRADVIRLAVREWLEARQNLPAKVVGLE